MNLDFHADRCAARVFEEVNCCKKVAPFTGKKVSCSAGMNPSYYHTCDSAATLFPALAFLSASIETYCTLPETNSSHPKMDAWKPR